MVKKPRTNRSATPRKPVIIEAEAKPVETKTDPAKTSEVSTTPKAGLKRVSTEAVKPPVPKEAPKPPVKKEEKLVPAKAEAPKQDDANKQKDPLTSAPKSSDGSNGESSVKGGVIGAILALLGAVGLNYAGVLPGGGSSVDGSKISAIETKIEALSSSTAATAPEFDPNSVQPLIDAALEKQGATLQAKIDALNLKLTDSGNSDASAKIAALEAQISELQSTVSSGSAGENEGMSLLVNRVDAVEGGLNSIQENLSSVLNNDNLTIPAEVTETFVSMQETMAENKQDAMSAIAALSDNVSEKIDGLTTQMQVISAQAADTSRQADVAAAIATAGLKAAIDRGGPFMAELETYAQVAPDSAIVEQLRPLAAKGVPTQSNLLKQFDSAAYNIIAAADAPEEGEGGVLSGLMSSAKSLVKVRPVGSVEGDSAGAITARMGEALKASNYAGVEAEFATLPEAAQRAGANFIASLQARQQADGLVQEVLNKALHSSASSTNQ